MLSAQHPWLWLLLPIAAAYAWWFSRRGYAQLEPWARRTSLFLRICIIALLISALARPEIVRSHSRSHAIYLLDISSSVDPENLEAGLAEIDRLVRAASDAGGNEQMVSVILFGEDARVFRGPAADWPGWSDADRETIRHARSLPLLYAERTQKISAGEATAQVEARIAAAELLRDHVAGDHSDIERAMRLAFNCGAPEWARSIYLVSDGQFNRGDVEDELRRASAANAPVEWIVLDRAAPPEVAATHLALPQRVRVNQSFTADLRVAATVATEAELVIFKDGIAVHERAIALQPGDNRIEIPGLSFREKGFHAIEAAVRSPADTERRNNRIRALITVPGETRVLYVDAEEDLAPYLASALELEGMQVEARPAAGVPESLSELLSYDVFILCNVPAEQLSMQQMQMIRTYVEDFGGGFIMLGGEESFGLGGYFNTPVEEALPVRMPIQKDLTRPSLALVLVIDKSGSMSGAKIELAKRAALASAEAINPRDQIAVVGFDSASRVIMELTSAGDRAAVASQVAALDAGGGTFMQPALADAQRILLATTAPKRHIIVLSDGQTEGFGYEEFAQRLAADGITLSTVGIGEGADMNLLEAMAGAGGGRAYFTNDFFSIPQIFTREALRASKNMLIERLVAPLAIEDDVSLREIDAEELPLLTGYVATTPRPAADTIIISDSGDPILAKWRFGLGRSAAFTSDTKPRWAEDWINWHDFAKFWSQLVRSIAGEDLARDLSIELLHERRDDGGVVVQVDIRDASDDFAQDVAIEATAVGADGASAPLEVIHIAPGLFEAAAPEFDYGRDQRFAWQITRRQASNDNDDADDETGGSGSRASGASGGGEPIVVPYGFVYSFPPEFETLGPNRALEAELAAKNLCTVKALGEGVPLASAGRNSERTALWPLLLAAALILIPFDILCRRVG